MEEMKNVNMPEELFTMSVQNREFWIPPKSEAECIESLKSNSHSKEKLDSMAMLVEIYRFEGQRSGGRYSDEGCTKLTDLMKRFASTVDLKKGIAKMALREGRYCEKVGDFPKAIRFYEASNTIYEFDDPEIRYFQLNNLAFCLNFSKRFSDAEKLLRKAIGIFPSKYNAWKNLGVSLEHQGQYEEAAECYLKAITYSNGEYRSKWHLDRLVNRNPSLNKIQVIKEWEFYKNQ